MSTQLSYDHQQQQQKEQWIVVTKNKNKHKGGVKNKTIHNRGSQNTFSPESQEEISQKFVSSKSFIVNEQIIEQCINKLLLISTVNNSINSNNRFHCQCLGLGNFLTNKKSLIQLLFFQNILIKLVNRLIQRHNCNLQQQAAIQLSTTNIYDPAFTKQQINYIKQKGYNLEQKFGIKEGKINIFFMPHCQRNLYELVYEQYSRIKEREKTPLIVIGNSIFQYKQRCEMIREKVPDIFLRIKIIEEKLEDYENALNDTFILA